MIFFLFWIAFFPLFWGERNRPFGFLFVVFWLWCCCFMYKLLSLWCLGWKVLVNCIDYWSLPSFLFNANSVDLDKTSAASDLDLHSLPTFLLRDARHKWVNSWIALYLEFEDSKLIWSSDKRVDFTWLTNAWSWSYLESNLRSAWNVWKSTDLQFFG